MSHLFCQEERLGEVGVLQLQLGDRGLGYMVKLGWSEEIVICVVI